EMFHTRSRENAEAVAAFLGTLRTIPEPAGSPKSQTRDPKQTSNQQPGIQDRSAQPDAVRGASGISAAEPSSGSSASTSLTATDAGRKLFDNLYCIACHIAPESTETDPGRIRLAGVGQKFAPGALETFLGKPDADFPAIRMPNFKLGQDEARVLADYLTVAAPGGKQSRSARGIGD